MSPSPALSEKSKITGMGDASPNKGILKLFKLKSSESDTEPIPALIESDTEPIGDLPVRSPKMPRSPVNVSGDDMSMESINIQVT